MQTMRNRRSPSVPNKPWTGPADLTIPQMLALLCALLLAGALFLVSGYLPGAATFGMLAGRAILTGFVGGVGAVVFYATADDRREPVVRQHLTYPFRRHVYRTIKEPIHDAHTHPTHADPIRLRPRRGRRTPELARAVALPRAGAARLAAAFRAIRPRRRIGQRP